jgi:Fe2+ transport system protein FeoA
MNRLTEAAIGTKYRVFTIQLPQHMVSYYRSAGVYPNAKIEVIALRGPVVSVHTSTDFRFGIHNDIAHHIIVEELKN